jgi:hypothetical protein
MYYWVDRYSNDKKAIEKETAMFFNKRIRLCTKTEKNKLRDKERLYEMVEKRNKN